MELDQFYRTLGRISYSFSSIDFVISNIAVKIGIVKTYPEFYAITSAEKKIKKLRENANRLTDVNIKERLTSWLDNLDELREKRNLVIHSIIMKNMSDDNDYRLHNFKKTQDGIERIIETFTTNDFELLDKQLIEVHNIGFEILEKIKNATKQSL